MKVLHASAPIVVPDGTVMGGYIDRQGLSSGLIDPLELHLVRFDDGASRFAFVVLDLVSVSADLTDAVRRELREHGINGAWVLATHTHSGPAVGTRPGGGGSTPGEVVDMVLGSLRSALQSMTSVAGPIDVSFFRLFVAGVAGRRNDQRSSDPLPVDGLIVRSGGVPVGIMIVTPVHSTVLGAENCQLSGDLNGGIRRALRSRFDCWVVSITGAAGDISTRYQRREQTAAEIDRLAGLIADAFAAGVDLGPHESVATDQAIVGPQVRTVPVETRSERELDGLLAQLKGREGTSSERAETVLRHGAQLAGLMRSFRLPDSIDVEIEAIRIGGVTLVALPCEPFLEVGERIVGSGLGETLVVGYANDYFGYLPLNSNELSYEVLSTPFSSGSADRILAGARGLLEEVDAAS